MLQILTIYCCFQKESASSTSSYDGTSLKNQKKKAKQAAEALDVQLIGVLNKLTKDEPSAIKTEVVDQITQEWRMYCRTFADKAAKLKKESTRDALRYEMESLLFKASKGEKEKEKKRKRKRREEQLHDGSKSDSSSSNSDDN